MHGSEIDQVLSVYGFTNPATRVDDYNQFYTQSKNKFLSYGGQQYV